MELFRKEEITLVTLQNVPANPAFISRILSDISKQSVNIDMISQEPPQGEHSSLSFTISDDDLMRVLVMSKALQEEFPEIKPVVSSANCKITLFDEGMREQTGVAARFFEALLRAEPDIRIITTSEVEIAVLVTKAHAQPTYEAIHSAFFPGE